MYFEEDCIISFIHQRQQCVPPLCPLCIESNHDSLHTLLPSTDPALQPLLSPLHPSLRLNQPSRSTPPTLGAPSFEDYF